MKRTLLSFLFSLFIIPFAFSQDMITTKSGDEIKAKVLEITPTEIKFITADKADVMQILPKANVFMIKYENGKKDVFSIQPEEVTPAPALNQTPTSSSYYRQTPASANPEDYANSHTLYLQGQNDAKLYYRDYKTAGTLTLVSTILYPPVGLVTAIGTSLTPPSRSNLDFPDNNLFKQPEYARGYTARAKKIKSGKVWTNFGIGAGSLLVVYGMLFAAMQQ